MFQLCHKIYTNLKGLRMFTDLTIRKKLTIMLSAVLIIITLSGSYIVQSVTPVANNWNDYNEQVVVRQQLLTSIKASFGYGGMIHS